MQKLYLMQSPLLTPIIIFGAIGLMKLLPMPLYASAFPVFSYSNFHFGSYVQVFGPF